MNIEFDLCFVKFLDRAAEKSVDSSRWLGIRIYGLEHHNHAIRVSRSDTVMKQRQEAWCRVSEQTTHRDVHERKCGIEMGHSGVLKGGP